MDGATHKPLNHYSVSPPSTTTTLTTPTPTPPSPTLCATCWTLSACSDLIPTHQLTEGLYQTSPCTAHARNLVHTAARGQGRRFMPTHPGFNLARAPTIYRISQPWEVEMEHNRGCNRLQHTWQCPTRPPPASCGRKWRSRVVAPHRGDMSVRAINPLSVISPKIEPRGWNRGGLSPVSPLIFLMGTHRLHRKQETSLSRTFFWEPHGYGLPTGIELKGRSRVTHWGRAIIIRIPRSAIYTAGLLRSLKLEGTNLANLGLGPLGLGL